MWYEAGGNEGEGFMLGDGSVAIFVGTTWCLLASWGDEYIVRQ